MLPENVYGHAKRLNWILSHLKKNAEIIEIGCGTGYMISFQLAKMGFSITGIDIDSKSIEYGQKLFRQEGLDSQHLQTADIASIEITPDVIIASEILEHLPKEHLVHSLKILREKLRPGGYLLVTVPNGFGWFELESFFWNKMKIKHIIAWLRLDSAISKLKSIIFWKKIAPYPHPNTLSHSPHVQRFTLKSIRKLLIQQEFEILQASGSTFFAGPFSNLLFEGMDPILKINCFLGSLFPQIAAGFFIACKGPNKSLP